MKDLRKLRKISLLFLASFALVFSACDGGKNEVKIEQVKEAPPEVPIAKSDANVSLPAGCDSGKNCFDEENPPLPVSPRR